MFIWLYLLAWADTCYAYVNFRFCIYKYKKQLKSNNNCDSLLIELLVFLVKYPQVLPIPKCSLLDILDDELCSSQSNIKQVLNRLNDSVKTIKNDGIIINGGSATSKESNKNIIEWLYPRTGDLEDFTLYGHYCEFTDTMVKFIKTVQEYNIPDEYVLSKVRSVFHCYFRFLILVTKM